MFQKIINGDYDTDSKYQTLTCLKSVIMSFTYIYYIILWRKCEGTFNILCIIVADPGFPDVGAFW